uniref:Uncharacterized protein n=1 Tax=Peronospora matthiolae TaxID=2874970 RepID=A0AAV1TZH1_9STRA
MSASDVPMVKKPVAKHFGEAASTIFPTTSDVSLSSDSERIRADMVRSHLSRRRLKTAPMPLSSATNPMPKASTPQSLD